MSLSREQILSFAVLILCVLIATMTILVGLTVGVIKTTTEAEVNQTKIERLQIKNRRLKVEHIRRVREVDELKAKAERELGEEGMSE